MLSLAQQSQINSSINHILIHTQFEYLGVLNKLVLQQDFFLTENLIKYIFHFCSSHVLFTSHSLGKKIDQISDTFTYITSSVSVIWKTLLRADLGFEI
ncbi:hypothetical protein Pfo_006906, partial [Paulownia fortunei]